MERTLRPYSEMLEAVTREQKDLIGRWYSGHKAKKREPPRIVKRAARMPSDIKGTIRIYGLRRSA